MTTTDDQAELTAALSNYLDAAFDEFADSADARRMVRNSIAGKVNRRALMKYAHAAGCEHGSEMAVAALAHQLAQILGVDPSTMSWDDMVVILRERIGA